MLGLAISRFGLLRLRLLQLRKARATILRESFASVVIPDAPISADTFKTTGGYLDIDRRRCSFC